MYFIFGILTSFLFYSILKPFLKRYAKDLPNNRSSHNREVPTAGGLIFIIPIMGYSFYSGNFIFLCLLPLVLAGFFDDLFNISRRFRLFVQAISILLFILLFDQPSIFINNINLLILFSMTFVGLTVINIFNFMDGLDGLLAGCALLIFSRSLFLHSPELSILIGSLIVFLLFNWCPAKVFMGDIGSTFLGAIYFIILINSSDFSEFIMHILIATPLLIDSLSCILIRFSKKQNIFIPHKLHLYQRLNQAGFKHSTISLIYMGSTSFLVLISTLNNNILLMLNSLAVILLGLFLNKKYAVKFN